MSVAGHRSIKFRIIVTHFYASPIWFSMAILYEHDEVPFSPGNMTRLAFGEDSIPVISNTDFNSVHERRCTDLPGYLSRPEFLY